MAPQPGEGRHQPGRAAMPTKGSGQLGDMGQGADATPGRRAHQRKQSKDQGESGAPEQAGWRGCDRGQPAEVGCQSDTTIPRERDG